MKPGSSANQPRTTGPGALKIHTSFQTYDFLKLISNSYISNSMCTDAPLPSEKKSGERFLFDGRGRLYTGYFSYSFGIETINTFIRSRSSFENHTRYQTKIKRLKQSPRRGRARSPHFLKKKRKKRKKKKKEKKYKFSNKRNL